MRSPSDWIGRLLMPLLAVSVIVLLVYISQKLAPGPHECRPGDCGLFADGAGGWLVCGNPEGLAVPFRPHESERRYCSNAEAGCGEGEGSIADCRLWKAIDCRSGRVVWTGLESGYPELCLPLAQLEAGTPFVDPRDYECSCRESDTQANARRGAA